MTSNLAALVRHPSTLSGELAADLPTEEVPLYRMVDATRG